MSRLDVSENRLNALLKPGVFFDSASHNLYKERKHVSTYLARRFYAAIQCRVIRAGTGYSHSRRHLIDPETGTILTDAVILMEAEMITVVGSDVTIPEDATVLDLSHLYVLPGLVDAHDHLALTYHNGADGGSYDLTTVLDGTVFKRDGIVTPMAFFHSGPEKGWRKR